EEEDDRFSIETDNDEGEVIADTTVEAVFINILKTGGLKVTKTVEGLEGCEDEFSFTVTLSDTTITGTYGDMEFKNGVATFTLKDGEEKIAEGLPSEITYKVEEEEDDRFSIETDNDEGEVIADTTVEAVFINILKVTKPVPTPPSHTVKTGEGNSFLIWICIGAAGIVLMILAIILKKRNDRKEISE
ncbi:MAG: hypothetical protein II749_06320, partial [Clostridia bacterium]|nr:hypothetical protein [Clostridia bacterium]